MASIKVGNPIEIEMTDEERVSYLMIYAEDCFAPESFQVFRDVLEEQNDIYLAFAQGAINEMVIKALQNAINMETKEQDGTE